MKNIAAAFVKAKRAFGPALKDKTNPHFRSKYADLGACIDAVEDALLANGIAFIQETSEDATGVTVETVFLHETGETLRCGKLHVPASKQDPQGYGSALTYARRYSLTAACGIAPEDDDGNAASKPQKRLQAVNPTQEVANEYLIDAPADRVAELDELALHLIDCHRDGQDMEAIRIWYAADTFTTDIGTRQMEQTYVWNQLKNESKLRAAIKANKPKETA